jgi:hypothetical protein
VLCGDASVTSGWVVTGASDCSDCAAELPALMVSKPQPVSRSAAAVQSAARKIANCFILYSFLL